LDLVQARSLYLRYLNGCSRGFLGLAVKFTLSLVAKGVLVLLEELPKVARGNALRKTAGPERVSGAVNRTFFVWLNGLFLRGYKSLLTVGELDNIPAKFNSQGLLNRLELHRERAKMKKEKLGPNGFAWATLRTLAGKFLLAILARMIHIALAFTQPLLVNRVIVYIGEASEGVADPEIARSLIGATVLIYAVLAVTDCVHQHLTYQIETMHSDGGVGWSHVQEDGWAWRKELEDGASVTLISTHVEGIKMGPSLFNSICSSLIEVGEGMFSLYQQFGKPCFLVFIPIILIK
jgi:hypothetical protein